MTLPQVKCKIQEWGPCGELKKSEEGETGSDQARSRFHLDCREGRGTGQEEVLHQSTGRPGPSLANPAVDPHTSLGGRGREDSTKVGCCSRAGLGGSGQHNSRGLGLGNFLVF